MNEIDYAVLALDVYNRVRDKGMFPNGDSSETTQVGSFTYVGSSPRYDFAPDFFASLYRAPNGEIVISFRGSDSVSDLFQGLAIVEGAAQVQVLAALKFYQEVQSTFPTSDIVF